MAVDTEEEQIEKIEQIWRRYKKLIISGVIIFLTSYFSYDYYSNQKTKNAEKASQLNQEILILLTFSINIS